MQVNRNWATPLVAGALLLSGVTGVLIFFRVDSGLNRSAHEWLSWVLLGGALLHLMANFAGLRRHLGSPIGRSLIGLFALILISSFFFGGSREPSPAIASAQALSEVPLSTLATVARLSPEELHQVLEADGLHVNSYDQTLRQLAGPDMGDRLRALQRVLAVRALHSS